jgi:hypothetical protein
MRTPPVVGLALSGAVLATALAFLARAQPAPQPAVPLAQPPGAAAPPGVGGIDQPPTKVEWMIGQPDRIMVRDVMDVGEVDLGENVGTVRVQGLIVYDEAKPAERVRGLAIVVSTAAEPITFVYDAEQVPDLIKSVDRVTGAAARLRVPGGDDRRQAVVVLNGLEMGVAAGGAVGHLSRVGPDQPSVRLRQGDFAQLKELLARGRDLLARDAQHQAAAGGGEGAGGEGK